MLYVRYILIKQGRVDNKIKKQEKKDSPCNVSAELETSYRRLLARQMQWE